MAHFKALAEIYKTHITLHALPLPFMARFRGVRHPVLPELRRAVEGRPFPALRRHVHRVADDVQPRARDHQAD